MHELFGVPEEEGATAGFSLILAHLAAGETPLLWLRTAGKTSGQPYGPGLAAVGLDPAR